MTMTTLTADHIQNRISSRFAVMPFSVGVRQKQQKTPEQIFFWDIKLVFDPKYKLASEVKNALRHLVCGFFLAEEGVMVD
jgi:hypothetical protein